jgi:Ca2+-binding EF-hand superfamily protein
VESGARWTLSHFFEYLGTPAPVGDQDRFSFESFASWYCSGGFNVAPWLELLDLNKVLSLLDDQHGGSPIPVVPPSSHGNHGGRGGVVTTARRPTVRRDRMSSLRRHHSARRNGVAPQPEILFTFPMAGGRSLVVLKDDAVYVREVVETLGLLTANPSATWMDLSTRVAKRRKPQKDEVAIYVNQTTFVQAMQETVPTYCRKRHLGESGCPHSVPEILSNFFQCFDIDRCDNVALDELMGGLSLLCGGKKSLKLAFAFGIFDTRPGMNKKMPGEGTTVHSLSGEDLFLFLRSVLIVLFSCCRQSLDMSDDVVGRCICDTANVICNDVMRHQWETKHLDRLNFDEFGQWYNDGGFERAPWLELLDLKKWVLVDDFETLPKQAPGHPIGSSRPPPVSHVAMARQSPSSAARSPKRSPGLSLDDGIPPPPPEDELDDSFFDESNIMAMDSVSLGDLVFLYACSVPAALTVMLLFLQMDDMDMFLSSDADNIKMASSFSFSPKHGKQQTPVPPQQQPASPGPPLSFHLTTSDKNGGYNMAFSHQRIDHLRRVLNESGLPSVDVREACDAILAKSVDSRSNDPEPRINKRNFDAAMKGILKWQPKTSAESKRTMNGVLDAVFACFDRDGQGKPCVAELACGITVLCQGKKSDKLEHAFEVLDVKKRQKLFKKEMNKYLQAFLSVLLSIAICPGLDLNPSHDLLTTSRGEPVERTAASVGRIVKSGADWATTLIFRDVENQKKTNSQITFDDFASWYTSKGHSSIPWLELIDLRKWVI